MNVKTQKVLIFTTLIISFMMGGYSFNQILWFEEHTYIGIHTWTINIEEWQSNTWNKKSTTTWAVVMNKYTNKWNSKQNKSIENTNSWWTKLILGQVSAGYDWETEYERVRNQIIKLWVSYDIAEHIVWEAYTNTENPKLFVKNIIGVSQAEWSIFKKWMYNNYLWVMARSVDGTYHLRRYDTVQMAISDWREMYNRNKRYIRTTAEKRLLGNYCTSACTHRVDNYNDAIYNLAI